MKLNIGTELLDSIGLFKEASINLRNDWTNHNIKKGLSLLDQIDDIHLELKLNVAKFDEIEDRKHQLLEIEYAIEIAENFIVTINISSKITSILKRFSKFIRTIQVTSELERINMSRQTETLNNIDTCLTNFLIHNEIRASIEWEKYPEHLIHEGKKQLDRISKNYGRRKSENEIIEEAEIPDFPANLFIKHKNYKLFQYFIEHFGYTKRPVDLSQIYRWMEEKQMIKPRSGIEYRAFSVTENLVTGSFSKLASENHDSQTTLNELFKLFSKNDKKEQFGTNSE